MLKILLHTQENDGLQVAVAEFLGTENPLTHFFSVQEKEEFLRLQHSKRRRERAATLQLLHEVLNVKKALHHHPKGEPYITDNEQHISISHTQHYVAIALHPSKKVGVDIEALSRSFANAAPRYLSEKEFARCNSNTLQCLAWCAKEAVYKIAGEEGIDFASQIALQNFEEKNEGEIISNFLGAKKQQSYLVKFRLINDIAVAFSAE